MDPSTYSQFTTTRGFHYSYLHHPPTAPNKKYILFLHGFPSSSLDWHHQTTHFSTLGHGILAPDLLGYGGSSKPLDTQAYSGKGMSDDVVELLAHEGIGSVIGVAHDWGSFLLSRLVNYHPAVLEKLVFLDVGYSAPGFGLTRELVGHVNQMVKGAMGYEVLGYFLFFAEEDAAALLDAHSDSAQSLFYSKDAELGKKYMGATGGFREWLTKGKVAPREAFFTDEDEKHYKETFVLKEGGGSYAAPIRWYIAQLENVNEAYDKDLSPDARIIKQPTLLITSSNFISQASDFPSQMKPNVPDLKVQKLDTGHWIMLEEPEKTNKILEEFF